MKKTFRALLLSAGLGTRLRPITTHTPKCLVKIDGEALLAKWFQKLERAGCEAALINTHYLATQVEEFVHNWHSPSMRITTVHEPTLLGTAGTLMANRSFFTRETGMLIHADNAMSGGLEHLLTAHEQRSACCELTMLTFKTDAPQSCGIVSVDEMGVVTGFHEKVEKPPGNCANGAVYAFDSRFLKSIEKMDPQPRDFSTEVIPRFLGRIQSLETRGPYIDIGTPQALARAQLMKDLG